MEKFSVGKLFHMIKTVVVKLYKSFFSGGEGLKCGFFVGLRAYIACD